MTVESTSVKSPLVGCDAWRNLIWEECHAVCALNPEESQTAPSYVYNRASESHPTTCFDPIPELPADEALAWYSANPAHDSSAEATRSVVVFQAGRMFLVGAPKQSIASYAELCQKRGQRNYHIVLLSFRPEHWSGLAALVAKSREHDTMDSGWPALTIWTSAWIWDEILSHSDNDELTEYLAALTHMHADQLPLKQPADLTFRNSVVTFQYDMTVPLALGTSITMDYAISDYPTLRATFTCNHLALTIDPAGTVDRLDTTGNSGKSWLTSVQDSLRERLPLNPDVHRVFHDRYGKWCHESWICRQRQAQGLETPTVAPGAGVLADSKQNAADSHATDYSPALASFRTLVRRDFPSVALPVTRSSSHNDDGWRMPGPVQSWLFQHAVDLSMCGRTPSNNDDVVETPKAADTRDLMKPPESPAGNGDPCTNLQQPIDNSEDVTIEQCIVMILCGALVKRSHRELLDPGRLIEFATDDGGGHFSRRQVTSILRWHLTQLDRWAETLKADDADSGEKDKLRVIVMVSPDTAEIVEREVWEYHTSLRRLTSTESRLSIQIIFQQLVPLLHVANDTLQPQDQEDENRDDGWEMETRGHLDFARLLVRWTAYGPPSERCRRRCVIISHNNLGSLFDDTTRDNLIQLRSKSVATPGEHAGCSMAVELFGLSEGDEDVNDERWKQLSFADVGESGSWNPVHLRKMSWPGASTSDQDPHDNVSRVYSSHTWYVDLAGLDISWFHQHKVLRTYYLEKLDKGMQQVSLRPRQDADQLTQLTDDGVLGIINPGSDSTEKGLLQYERFRVVRTSAQLVQASQDLRLVMNDGSQDSTSLWEPIFAETHPSYRRAVWAGFSLSTLKEIERQLIAESWEVSTHPAGPSVVYQDCHTPHPLSALIRQWTTRRDPHSSSGEASSENGAADLSLPYMVKYLDCHDALSIQLHPNASTAKHLKGFGRQSSGTQDSDEDISLELAHHKEWRRKWQNTPMTVKDEWGKEESFFVLHVSGLEKFHLYLGMERDALGSIAHCLLPVLQQTANKSESTISSEDIATITKKLCEALVDDKNSAAQQVMAYLWDSADPLNQSPAKDQHEQYLAWVRFGIQGEVAKKGGNVAISILRDQLSPLEDVLLFHLGDAGRKSVLGKEYLFAAIGVIRLIEVTRKFLINSHTHQPNSLPERALSLFDSRRDPPLEWKKRPHPLYQFFHRVRVTTGQWVRIPAGTIHSWQGGGNLLIELSNRSDNTFRILDYGRELSSQPRPMHYREAMYALGEESILNTDSENRLCFDSDENGQPTQSCHNLLSYRLVRSATRGMAGASPVTFAFDDSSGSNHHSGDANLQPINDQQPGSVGVLLNPDSTVDLWSTSGRARQHSQIPPCRAVMIKPDTSFQVKPAQDDNQLLYVYPRRKQPSLLCLSLGGTKWELTIYYDEHTPPTSVFREAPDWNPDIKVMSKAIEQWLKAELNSLFGAPPTSLEIQCCITWPGPLAKTEKTSPPANDEGIQGWVSEPTKMPSVSDTEEVISRPLDSLGLKVFRSPLILSDAQASAFGEHRAYLGRLGQRPGMVLNIASGLCAGFITDDELSKSRLKESFSKPDLHLFDPTRVALSAIGRWLYIDPSNATFAVLPHVPHGELSQQKLLEHVLPLDGKSPPERVSGPWIRASKWLSNTSVIFRFLQMLNEEELKNFEAEFRQSHRWGEKTTSKVTAFVKTLHGKPTLIGNARKQFSGKLDPIPLFLKINEAFSLNNSWYAPAYELITSLSWELAQVIIHLRRTITFLDGENNDPQLAAYRACTDRIVLTGMVGQLLGRVAVDSNPESNPEPDVDNDEQVPNDQMIYWIMKSLDPPDRPWICRSDIQIASQREADGFLHYQWLLTSTTSPART